MIVLLLLASAPSTQAQGLDLYMAASSEVTSPGDRVTYSVTATNTGPADLLDVTVEIALPDHISSFQARDVPDVSCGSGICGADRVATWSVGTLAPGESRSVFYHPEITDSAPETTIMSNATASASNATEASASLDVRIDPTPLLRLSVAPAPGPAVPGEPFTYTLTFGNIGSSSPSDVVLTMPVPEGSSFISASDAGTETGGLVTWDLGLLPSAGSGKVRLTVEVDETLESGEVLEATAALDPGVASEYVAQSSAVTPVRAGSPLGLSYAVDQTTAGAGDALTYSVTATNTGPADLLDVTARILLPGSITSFQARDVPDVSCGSGICGADKVATWTVGTLSPRQSRTVTFHTSVAEDVTLGSILRSFVSATASNANSQVLAQANVLAGALLDFVPPAVPVGLAATFGDGEVTLTWTANAEGDLDSYRLYRDTAPGATTLLAEIGAGATSYVDDVTEAGATYFYRLTAVDQAGNESFFSNEVTVDVVSTAFETDQGLPATFALAEAYPNPFNPQTTIRYALPQAVHVRLVVYDLLGRPVAVLVDREQAAGRYDVVLKAAGLPSGVYLYSLQTDAFNLTRRVVLLK